MAHDDAQLLSEYVEKGSQAAFAELSRRYVNLVYSSALRQMRDAHAAEDVTQAVFIVLARKARGLRRDIILSSWLLRTTQYAVSNARRAELRRRQHEQEAAQMKTISQNQEGDKLWERISPAIDKAIDSLAAPYRDAVVLRYFDGESFEEIARRLKISEEAARQRISRAVAELRKILAKKRAITGAVGAAVIASALEANAVASAPASLAAACAAIAGASQTWPWMIAKGVMKMFLLQKMAGGVLVLMLVSGLGVVVATRAQNGTAPIEAAGKVEPQAVEAVRRPAIEGTVIGVNGQPLAAAQVYLADPNHPVTVYSDEQVTLAWIEGNGGFAGLTGYQQKPANRISTTSDAQGKFRFPPAPVGNAFRPDEWAVVVASEQGFAHVWPDELKESQGKVQLAQWGQIEGTLRSEDKVIPNAVVRLARLAQVVEGHPHMVQYEDETRTDEQGNFKFTQVAPGDTWLMHTRAWISTPGDQTAYVRVEPGKMHRVRLGGVGRPVTGQLVEGPGSKEKLIWIDRYHYTGGSMRLEPYPTMVEPANWMQLTTGQKAALRAKYSQTPEGRIHNEQVFHFLVEANPDGTFRIPDVPAGKYRLMISSQHGRNAGALVASLNHVFEVPPMAQERMAEPLDLGKLPMQMEQRLALGEAAPDFVVKRLDGQGEIRLSDHRGKVVLVQFWPSRMPVEALDLRYIKRAAELAGKEKLAVIGIGMGSDREQMLKMAAEGAMTWSVGHAEHGSQVARDWHVRNYGVFVIGADGKVLARQLSDRQIVLAVQDALAEMQAK